MRGESTSPQRQQRGIMLHTDRFGDLHSDRASQSGLNVHDRREHSFADESDATRAIRNFDGGAAGNVLVGDNILPATLENRAHGLASSNGHPLRQWPAAG